MFMFKDAFISYGRPDSRDFTIALKERLTTAGLNIWVDLQNIPLAVDFRNEIKDGIEKADNFLFIISPHAVNSAYCRQEIEYALKCSKRIVPVLHKAQIDQETWQRRNPQGSEADWVAYQAKGLHFGDDRNPNMHPAIAQINWVPFIEGVSDFEESLQKLLQIFERHQAYVHQHTVLLAKALEWEKQQRQPSHLLIGADCQQAHTWLITEFKHEQPPCLPADLHCEYITESLKNLSDLMTQVFLSYTDEDTAIAMQIRRSLIRQGFTVWTNQTDVQKANEARVAIQRGLEDTDNVVCLLSTAALRSELCRYEIDYALSLNKRIIPLLIHPIAADQMPIALPNLQCIDLIEHQNGAAYQLGINQLIRILRQDAIYYTVHKFILSKALKWQRQQRNPSLLVRGHNLRFVEAWYQSAKTRSHHLPIPVQEDYIYASLQQPPGQSLDVFISYSRVNSEFVIKLNNELESQGKTTWFDQHTIAPGTDFQEEIHRGIELSDHFLFVLSPSSITSPYCADEVEYAKKLNKRIVTVLYEPIDTANLHPVLATVQWIDFNRYNRDFYTNFGELIRVLDTDLEHLRSHTRLMGRALEWERSGHDPSFLLRGTDLVASEQWLQQAARQSPPPTGLQTRYIRTSRKSPLRQAKPSQVGLTALAATLFVLALRLTGLFQPLELATFDAMVRLRPPEPPDDRFLVIEITEDDIQTMFRRREKGRSNTLSDESLNRLLQKLAPYQPRLIGLDLYRDFEVDASLPGLAAQFRQNQRLLAVCKLPEIGQQKTQVATGAKPPHDMPLTQVGFSDVYPDADRVIRRQAVYIAPPDGQPCQAKQAFGFLLAHRYLEQEQGQNLLYKDPVTSGGVLQLGQVVFQRLDGFDGGYQRLDAAGFQILLNYRVPKGGPTEIADRISLGDFLNDRVPADKQTAWKNRIVVIGVTSQVSSQKDYMETPYGAIPGVVYQTQVASQILSAVLNGRPLMKALTVDLSLLWIGLWALMGGTLVYYVRSPGRLAGAIGGAIGGLVLACTASLIAGSVWVPLIPAFLALMLATGGVLYIAAQFPTAKPIRKHRL